MVCTDNGSKVMGLKESKEGSRGGCGGNGEMINYNLKKKISLIKDKKNGFSTVCLYVPHVCAATPEAADGSELPLGAGNRTQVPCRNSKDSKPLRNPLFSN